MVLKKGKATESNCPFMVLMERVEKATLHDNARPYFEEEFMLSSETGAYISNHIDFLPRPVLGLTSQMASFEITTPVTANSTPERIARGGLGGLREWSENPWINSMEQHDQSVNLSSSVSGEPATPFQECELFPAMPSETILPENRSQACPNKTVFDVPIAKNEIINLNTGGGDRKVNACKDQTNECSSRRFRDTLARRQRNLACLSFDFPWPYNSQVKSARLLKTSK